MTRKNETKTFAPKLILVRNNINCRDVVDRFGDYVDNELPKALKAKMTTHVDSCVRCQEFEAGYKMVIDLAKELRVPPMPRGVRSRLHAALNKELGLNLPV